MEKELLITFDPGAVLLNKMKQAFHPYYRIRNLNDFDSKSVEIIVCSEWPDCIDEKVFNNFTNLKYIHTLFAGVNHLPYWLFKKEIKILTASGALSHCIAEHALALLLSSVKHININAYNMSNHLFNQDIISNTLFNSTIGIVGYGHIGQQFHKLVTAFNPKIYAIKHKWDKNARLSVDFSGTLSDLNYLFAHCNYILLSIPLNIHTEGIININLLKQMKKDSVIVNVARGKIIKEDDMYSFLRERKDVTAALDVWWHYPKCKNDSFKQKYPFENLNNCVCTPHIATNCKDFLKLSIEYLINNILRYIKTGIFENVINNTDYYTQKG